MTVNGQEVQNTIGAPHPGAHAARRLQGSNGRGGTSSDGNQQVNTQRRRGWF